VHAADLNAAAQLGKRSFARLQGILTGLCQARPTEHLFATELPCHPSGEGRFLE
jgi:hypothetical protein